MAYFRLIVTAITIIWMNAPVVQATPANTTNPSTPVNMDAFKAHGQIFPPDIQSITQMKVLRVAILNVDISPFVFRNIDNEFAGIDIDFAKKIAAELGVQIEFVPVASFDEVINQVETKNVHMGISKLSVTFKRAKRVRFVGEYVSMSKGLLLNRIAFKKLKDAGANTIEEIFETPGATLGVIDKSAYESFARILFPKAEIKIYKNWDDLVEATFKGEVLGALRDEWEIRKTLTKRPDLPLFAEAIFLKHENDPIKIAVAWDSFQLAEFINTFMRINDGLTYDVKKLFKVYKGYLDENKLSKK